jgi:hypothetical protein
MPLKVKCLVDAMDEATEFRYLERETEFNRAGDTACKSNMHIAFTPYLQQLILYKSMEYSSVT